MMKEIVEIQINNENEDSDSSINDRNLDFYWNVTSFSKDDIVIQCHFDEPIYVSSTSVPDTISIRFVETSFFFDFAGQNLEEGTILEAQMPPQL